MGLTPRPCTGFVSLKDLNTTNNLGESALSLACHWCYGVVVKLLLLHGADCGPAVRWLESGDWRDEGVMEVLQVRNT